MFITEPYKETDGLCPKSPDLLEWLQQSTFTGKVGGGGESG